MRPGLRRQTISGVPPTAADLSTAKLGSLGPTADFRQEAGVNGRTILLAALWTTNKPTMWKIIAATAAWPRFKRDEIIEASVLTAVVAVCA
jgi:hypothetical protein